MAAHLATRSASSSSARAGATSSPRSRTATEPRTDKEKRPVLKGRPLRLGDIFLLSQCGAGALDAAAGFLEEVGRGRVGDAEGRTLAERRTLHHRQALRFEQVVHEVGVVADRLAVRRLLADRAGA